MNRKRKLRIAIAVSHGFHTRVLLRSQIFQILRQQAEILILSPNANEPEFVKEFKYDDVILTSLLDQQTWLETKFEGLRKNYFSNPKLLATLNIKNERLKRNQPIKYKIMRSINLLTGRLKAVRDFWLWLEEKLFPDRKHQWIFTDFKPDALVTATPGVFPADARLIRTAKKRGIKTFCVVQSWDNLTSKGYMGARPDKLIVWNHIMAREAIDYHQYHKKDIYVAGVPHFDIYTNHANSIGKAGLREKLGLQPDKAVIFFGTTASVHYPHNLEIVDILADALKNGDFVKPAQIFVRLHPEAVSGAYKEDLAPYFEYSDWIKYDIPESKSQAVACDLDKDDLLHLHEILSCADVTINTASTLTIDACAHQCPVINIAFDGYQKKEYINSSLRFYDYTHYKNIVRTGAVQLAKSPQDLVEMINRYLQNPELEAQNRQQVVAEQCYQLDGYSGERVANYIISYFTQEVAAFEQNGKVKEKDTRAFSISK